MTALAKRQKRRLELDGYGQPASAKMRVLNRRLRKERLKLSRPRKPMGFAAIPRERVCEIASLGGMACSSDREHMAEIGAKGGKARKGWRKARATFRKEHPL